MVFAGLTQRVIAGFIDAFLLGSAIMALAVWMPRDFLNHALQNTLVLTVAVVWLAVIPATKLGGTLGKRITGIRVTTPKGEPLGIMRSLARFAFLLLTIGTAGIGFLVAAWTPKRQALHDFGAQTVVVLRRATPDQIASAVAPPLWWFNRLLGIVFYAALAAGLLLMLDARRSFETRVDTRAVYARPDGSIVLEVADMLLPGGRVVYTPSIASGKITWRCTAESIERKYLPPPCRH